MKTSLKWLVLSMFLKLVKSAIVCLCPCFFVFAKISRETELSVNKVGFTNFVEVMGFTYVFEDGWKCNCLWISVFFCVCHHCCFKIVWKMKCLIISSVKKSSASLFLQKKWGASLFLQKQMKCLIISPEKNEVPHYFFRKKQHFFFEEIMSRFIFSSRNNEAPHVFWRNNKALDFLSAEITFAGWKGFRWKLIFLWVK